MKKARRGLKLKKSKGDVSHGNTNDSNQTENKSKYMFFIIYKLIKLN